MEYNADIEHSLIRFDELVQLFKMRQVFVFHDWENSGLWFGVSTGVLGIKSVVLISSDPMFLFSLLRI